VDLKIVTKKKSKQGRTLKPSEGQSLAMGLIVTCELIGAKGVKSSIIIIDYRSSKESQKDEMEVKVRNASDSVLL